MIAIKSPEHYLNQDGLTGRVGEYVSPYAKRIAIITSPTAWQLTRADIERSLAEYQVTYSLLYLRGPCTRELIDSLASTVCDDGAQAILGIGGGRVMDAAKAVGHVTGGLPVINLPTIAATCAAWSPISVIYDERGGHQGPLDLARLPVWVLVDSELIAKSPVRYLKAGIIDGLAKWYEFSPYQRSGDGSLGLLVKAQAARLAQQVFAHDGVQAVEDNQQQRVTPVLRKVIDGVIALAGLANSVRDDIARIGVAHAIHNSITHHQAFHHLLHGEKVGFGLAVQGLLEYPLEADRQELLQLLVAFGAPVTLDLLGLDVADSATLGAIAAGVRIAPSVLARLPFEVDADRITRAILATAELNVEGIRQARLAATAA